jgi:hypothetical protein
MKVKLYWDSYGDGEVFLPAGTVIDHKDAWILVRNGHAEPVDQEAKEKANMTTEELLVAKERYHKLAMGRATGDRRYDAPIEEADDCDELFDEG